MDREDAALQRRVLARFILDFAPFLPPVFAQNWVTSLFLGNLGDTTALLQILSCSGDARCVGPESEVLDFFMVMRVYWLVWLPQRPKLDDVLTAEKANVRGMDVNVLNKIVRKLGLRAAKWSRRARMAQLQKATGEPEIVPYASAYDLEQLTRALP